MTLQLQSAVFDPGRVLTEFTAAQKNAGAVVSFTGIVRNTEAGDLQMMEIEHYPAMTKPAITAMIATAQSRWALADAQVIHRYGTLTPGEVIMMVLTAARHRADAFAGAEFLMDYLKSRAPFWKKEITPTGAAWVQAREADEQALARW